MLSQLVFRQNRSGNFTRYTNYEVVHESGLISGYDSVLKMGYPDLGDRLTLGFALSDLFVGDIGDYPSISFVIKHNGRILAGEIARLMDLSPGRTTNIINMLEKRKYISR